MCGIFCEIVGRCDDNCSSALPHLATALRRRGPDYAPEAPLVKLLGDKEVRLFASVLWLRGREMSKQPLEDTRGNVLLWNGDVFGGQVEVPSHLSDTKVIAAELEKLDDEEIPAFFSQLMGPFSFVYFRPESGSLWFGRDFFGRHCLLVNTTAELEQKAQILLTSVGASSVPCSEVPSVGVFRLAVATSRVTLHPWQGEQDLRETILTFPQCEVGDYIRSPVILPQRIEHLASSVDHSWVTTAVAEKWTGEQVLRVFAESDKNGNGNVGQLLYLLENAVRTRVEKQIDFCKACTKQVLKAADSSCCEHAKVGVLFSGGLDSAVLAIVADRVVAAGQPIQLLNVAFQQQAEGGFNVPDRLTAEQALKELQELCPEREFQLVKVDVTREELARGKCDLGRRSVGIVSKQAMK